MSAGAAVVAAAAPSFSSPLIGGERADEEVEANVGNSGFPFFFSVLSYPASGLDPVPTQVHGKG